MKDYILRVTAASGYIRAFFANTRELVQYASRIHNTSPVVSAALGRTMTAAAMMSTMLKNEGDLLNIRIKGEGPLRGLLVTADKNSVVKGYPFHSDIDIPLKQNGKLDVSGAIGKGYLTVIKDSGLKQPYVGQTELVTSEIAEDFTYYFYASEQTPSSVALGVLVDRDLSIKQAGGFIVQLLPGCDDEIIAKLEAKIKAISSFTSLLEDNKSCEDIVNIVLGDFDPVITDTIYPKFECNCSQDKIEKALISIGVRDLTHLIEKDKKAELTCHFCNKKYHFNETELKKLLEFATTKDVSSDNSPRLEDTN